MGEAAAAEARGEARFRPLAENRRTLSGLDLALLWFGAAIVVDEIWSGAQIVSSGLFMAVLIILVGRFLSNLLLGAVSRMGQEAGQPTMVLTRLSFGNLGSYLPAVANILQLIGWTSYMLIIACRATRELGVFIVPPEVAERITPWLIQGGVESYFDPGVMVLTGLLTTAWAMGGERFWHWAQRIAGALLFVVTLVMTYAILKSVPLGEIAQVRVEADRGLMLNFDFVVAMGISWVPLAADYGRFARSRRASFWGTHLGYFAGSVWMYVVGVLGGLAFALKNPGTPIYEFEPARLVAHSLEQLGGPHALKIVVVGLTLVLISTLTTTFLDIYSAAVSSLNLWPKLSERWLSFWAGMLGIVLALWFAPSLFAGYFDFLLMINSVFLPIFAVVLTDYLILRRGKLAPLGDAELSRLPRVSGAAVIAFVVGLLISVWGQSPSWAHTLLGLPAWPEWKTGSAIPSFIITALVYLGLVRLMERRGKRGKETYEMEVS